MHPRARDRVGGTFGFFWSLSACVPGQSRACALTPVDGTAETTSSPRFHAAPYAGVGQGSPRGIAKMFGSVRPNSACRHVGRHSGSESGLARLRSTSVGQQLGGAAQGPETRWDQACKEAMDAATSVAARGPFVTSGHRRAQSLTAESAIILLRGTKWRAYQG
jgi:hypothetical protein